MSSAESGTDFCECGAPKFGGECTRKNMPGHDKIVEQKKEDKKLAAKKSPQEQQLTQGGKSPGQLGGVLSDLAKHGGYD